VVPIAPHPGEAGELWDGLWGDRRPISACRRCPFSG